MSDSILLILTADFGALLLLGALAKSVPAPGGAMAASILSGLGSLICLAALLSRMTPADLTIPLGPPGLSLHLLLNPLSHLFLVLVLLAGAICGAIQVPMLAAGHHQPVRAIAFCVSGAGIALLASNGVTLAFGLAIVGGATLPTRKGPHRLSVMLVPTLISVSMCLLTPAGYAATFDAIRATPPDVTRAITAVTLAVIAAAALVRSRVGVRDWTRDALVAGVLMPLGFYLMLRVIPDLSGSMITAWWGFLLLLAGGSVAIHQAWRAAAHPDLDFALSALMGRQFGLVMTDIGLVVVARASDLPEAAVFALEATCLAAINASVAGTLLTLSFHRLGAGAGTYRLSRLGGIGQTMPVTSAAIAAGLWSLSTLPPGLGFASLWLSFQSILLAPRTGGLLSVVPIALALGAIALSAALSTTASLRIVGIAILGRPRTLQSAGASETRTSIETVLLATSVIAFLAGLLSGPLLRSLAGPAIRAMAGLASDGPNGPAHFPPLNFASGYLSIPVFMVFAVATSIVLLATRRSRMEAEVAGPWTDGMPPPSGLPFGDPAAQSTGTGFLPTLPQFLVPKLRRLVLPQIGPPPLATAGPWMMLGAFAILLLVLATTS